MATVLINQPAIYNALISGLQDTVRELDQAYTTAIESPRYGWPGETLRRSGERAGTTRNIVDLGAFRDSQEYRFINPFLAEFSWGGGSVDYAPQIFFGYTTTAGNSFPARNPVAEAHKITDPTELFGDSVRRYA